MNIIKKIIVILTVCLISFSLAACGKQGKEELLFCPNVSSVGVWWWHTSASSGISPENIEWAAKNGVTEIYYATTSFSQRHSDFIARASEKNIKVYLLVGEWEWIYDDSGFQAVMNNYLSYQNASLENRKFAGIHLDVEPHQSPEWPQKRPELLELYLDFVMRTVGAYPLVSFDFDIPFWFTDNILYKNQTVPLYQALITEASRVFIMSYRDSAEKMYNLGTVPQQVEFAYSLDKPIFLCAEAIYEDEGSTIISYGAKGKKAMYEELNKLKYLANYEKLGIAIHHMKSWLALKP